MRHRIGLTYEAESAGLTADRILADIVKKTPIPGALLTPLESAVT